MNQVDFLSIHSGMVNRGAERYVHELASRLVKTGLKVRVHQTGKIYSTNYETVIHKTKNQYIFTKEALTHSKNTDVIIPVNGRMQSLMCSFWAIRNHKKVIISGQSGIGWDDRLNLYTFPNMFVALTDYQYNWAKKINPFVPRRIIPNGVDIASFNRNIKPQKIDLPRPIILYVASLTNEKRAHLLINAAAKLKNASVLLVGSGPLKNKLLKQGKNLLNNRFEIRKASFEEMPSYYTSADIFTYPTFSSESFGISMIEAMASGLAVVGTRDAIRNEIIGEAGILVDPEKTDDYAQALELAINKDWKNKPELQAQKFSWDKIASEYYDLIKNLK